MEAVEAKAAVDRSIELRELLDEFGLTLHSFDPGVHAFLDEPFSLSIHFDGQVWNWIEPLLKELRARRRTPYVKAVLCLRECCNRLRNQGGDISEITHQINMAVCKDAQTVLDELLPKEAKPAMPTTTCNHAPDEPCMICVVCGQCSDWLSDSELCTDCNTAKNERERQP